MPPLLTEPVRLALTSTGDVEIPLRFVSGVAAVAQGCRERLRAVMGEWFRDLNLGVPWFENDRVTAGRALLGQRFDDRRVRTAMRTALLADDAVAEILRLDISFVTATRVLTVRWQVRCAFGNTSVETLEI